MNRSGDVHRFVDADGNPTIDYPHVHVIHFKSGKTVVVSSILNRDGKPEHPWKKEIYDPVGDRGQEIEEAISRARGLLAERKIGLLWHGEENGYIRYRSENGRCFCSDIIWSGQRIPAVYVTPGENGSAQMIRVNETFDLTWGKGAKHNLSR